MNPIKFLCKDLKKEITWLIVLVSQALAQPTVNVSTLSELCAAVQLSDQNIVMKPGNYNLTDLPSNSRDISCSGSNNTINLTDVYVNATVGATSTTYINISGSNNTFRGGTFEDTYSNGMTEVTDFSSYNQDRSLLAKGLKGAAVLNVSGNSNLIVGVTLTVRGSYPFGYGSIYGIGSNNVYGLDKRCALNIHGVSNTVDSCEVQQQAFGHGIYIQPPADKTTIKNTLVEGVVRPSKDLYEETNSYDLPYRSDYKMPLDGDLPIPKDEMWELTEDGIRIYTDGGSATVENCTVKKMRGGIRLYLGSGGTVSNSTAIDCGSTNFNLPNGGTITNSSGNFAYAPLSDFRLGRSNMDIEWTIIPSPHAIGPHNIADVQGNKHTIVFRRTPGPLDTASRPIVVTGDNSTIRNETEYRIILESGANNNTITSAGEVIDNGSNNDVTQIGVVNTLMDVKAIKPSPTFKKIDKILIVNNAPDIRNLEVYDLKGRLKTRSWGPSIQKGVLLPKGVYIVKSGNKK